MRALCTLVKRFEIVVPAGGTSMDMSGASGSAASVSEQMRRVLLSMAPDGPARVPCRLSAETSMVYYDGPGFPEYQKRVQLRDDEPPCGFRSRQTAAGGRTSAPGQLVERDGAASALSQHAFTPLSLIKSPDAFPLQGLGSLAPAGDPAQQLRDAADRVLAALPASGGLRSQTSSDEMMGLGEESCAELLGFAREVKETLAISAPLRPVAAVGSTRVLLQGDTTATSGISIAVDEDVQLSRELPDSAATAPGDAIDFPYCLLEITENGDEASPSGQCIEELRGFAALRKVAGFSIGTHAVASLHKDDVPELPHWYQHLDSVERTAPPEAWGLMLEWRQAVGETQGGESPRKADAMKAAESLKGSTAKASKPPEILQYGGEPAEKASVLPLEPKNYMASERTMLEWMHTVLALAFLGIGLWRVSMGWGTPLPIAYGLLNGASTSSITLGAYALVLVAIAIVFAWYAFFSHIRRLNALQSGGKLTEGVFNRRTGPMIFSIAVGVALVGHMAVQVIPIWLSGGSGGGGHGGGGVIAAAVDADARATS